VLYRTLTYLRMRQAAMSSVSDRVSGSASTEPTEPLSVVGHGALQRKMLGRYDTPRPLSQAMADWAIREAGDSVLEPSSGSGVFLRSASRRLRELGATDPADQIWGCDIDPAAVAQSRYCLQQHYDHVVSGDFLTLIDSAGFVGRKFKCIVGNPPFISMHRMDSQQRAQASALIARSGVQIDRKASLWAYFLAGATCALSSGGNLALILPEAALHAQYGKAVLSRIADCFRAGMILGIRERCFVGDGAAERIVLFLGEHYVGENARACWALEECGSVKAAIELLQNRAGRCRSPDSEGVTTAAPLMMSRLHPGAEKILDIPCSTSLAEIAEIRIGVVTGADRFFVLSEPRRKELRIPLSAVIPLMKDFRLSAGISYQKKDWQRSRNSASPCWLLVPRAREKSKAVLSYLDSFPKDEIDRNCTFSKRKPWYVPTLGRYPDAFLRYMGGSGPRILLAGFAATCTNSVHRIYFKKAGDHLLHKAIGLSLHSSYSRLSAECEGRTYGSGVLKLEPSEAKRLRLIVPESIDRPSFDECLGKFQAAQRAGDSAGAARAVDDWLAEQMPGLARELDFTKLRQLVEIASERRRGRISNPEAGRNG
jgi:adenine-specific DNA-methyltransferase